MLSPIKIYKFSHYLFKKKFIKAAKFLTYVNRVVFSVWIPHSVIIGENFKLGYLGLGIVIHHNCKIGNNVTIAQNVTIGRNFGDNYVPKIGDDVYIGTGSVVFGEITIGNNVIIGSNTVVNKNIPDNCTVVGNPFKVIQTNRTKKYYQLDENREIF
ncbi:serine O-acetyltransferase [Sphingobacterium composti Ten et al. 2007 non Yoo et al. 2007]|uniref:serine O-acetyltransferase n=1 Tax=Sphingobacterium composti TaxID=363260 RepID=UPI0013570C99|nr:serine acetyltransferase [Sphingobacterium composti Ten et al. 2007 non Yoo et al. 2007]